MDINQKIRPFRYGEYAKGAFVMLPAGGYRDEVFNEREGFIGNGYDWTSLAEVFLRQRMSELKGVILFDPSADMFSASSTDTQAVEAFAIAFHALCEDKEQMRTLFAQAKLD